MSEDIPQKVLRKSIPQDFYVLCVLGYVINLDHKQSAAYVNLHFPNLDLLKWMEILEKLILKEATPPVYKEITFSKYGALKIDVIIADHLYADDELGLALHRQLRKEGHKMIVEHKLFRVPSIARGNNLARKTFIPSIQQYINIDVDLLLVTTGLTDGGLVWARYHFEATEKRQMEVILAKGKRMLDGTKFAAIKKIFDTYYVLHPDGERFPIVRWANIPFMKDILLGTSWEGVIDFKNKDQLLNFIKYVRKEL
ncbi:hypothetical protein [Pedobacter duraquae]|uniref:Uncharacterized protein n=1 Tax=Pedobacter duraquae TaxID=425511 RepID=A0A4R6IPL9_9SPHI|nr:hypothetical protein [Pedobacter duraquae]TDO24213.1 hypothetical protein CLV32_0502 [Pedobacter duraquae]